jgi:hypothetical protein
MASVLGPKELHVIWSGYMMINTTRWEFPLEVHALADAIGFLAPKYEDMHAPYTYNINTTRHVKN